MQGIEIIGTGIVLAHVSKTLHACVLEECFRARGHLPAPRAARCPLAALHVYPAQPASRYGSLALPGGFGVDFPVACLDEGEIEALADLPEAAAEGLAGQGAHFHREDTLLSRIMGLPPSGHVPRRACPQRLSCAWLRRTAPGACHARGGVRGARGARRRSCGRSQGRS